MKNWKSRLFGDTPLNFYGWLGAGLLAIGASLWLVIRALRTGALDSPVSLLLLAIYFVLVAHLGLALQSYHGRLGHKLDARGRGGGQG